MADLDPTEATVVAAADAQLGSGTSGATITQGMPIYLNTATGKYELCDADFEARAVCAGISLNVASDTQPVDFIKSGTLTIPVATAITVGLQYYVSGFAGNINEATPSSGNYVTSLGIGLTTSSMIVSITVSGVATP